jgi:SAM-dependent methyltransferase
MDYFREQAALYAEFRPDYPPELFQYIAAIAPRRTLAWDCATGSGQAATGLAGHFDHVIATDASADQIAHARPHPKVEYRVAQAESSGIAEHSVDAIEVSQALHWFNSSKFFEEVRRVGAPGAVLVVTVYTQAKLPEPALDASLQHFTKTIVGPYWPPERKLLDDEYRAIPFPFERIAAPELKLEKNWDLRELAGYVRSWSATVRYVKAHGFDPVMRLEADLAEKGWHDPAERKTVTWPFRIFAGRVAAN